MFPECAGIAPTPSRWRHGAPGVVPVYHGIWQPSRLLPVSPGCFKHFKTTGDMSRFNTVHPESPRLSTMAQRLWHSSSRFIPDHQTGMNRHLKPGQWERGFNENHKIMCWITYARSKSFLSFSTPICQCLINNSYVSAQWYTIGRKQTKQLVERGDNTYYSLYFFQDFSEKSPKQKNEHGDTYFLFNH